MLLVAIQHFLCRWNILAASLLQAGPSVPVSA